MTSDIRIADKAKAVADQALFLVGDIVEAQYRTCAGYITDEWYRAVVIGLNSNDTYHVTFGSSGEDGYWLDAPRQHIRMGIIQLIDTSAKGLMHSQGMRTLIVRTLDGSVFSKFQVQPSQITVFELKRMIGMRDTPSREAPFVQLLYGDRELMDTHDLGGALGDDKAIADITFIKKPTIAPCGKCDLTDVCGGCLNPRARCKLVKTYHEMDKGKGKGTFRYCRALCCGTEERCESPFSCCYEMRDKGDGKGKGKVKVASMRHDLNFPPSKLHGKGKGN